jgi:hypothetical protein
VPLRVLAENLLGFIVLHRRIEVNLEKIKAILDIRKLTCLKDIQRLTCCVAAVSRFVSLLGEKAMPSLGGIHVAANVMVVVVELVVRPGNL